MWTAQALDKGVNLTEPVICRQEVRPYTTTPASAKEIQLPLSHRAVLQILTNFKALEGTETPLQSKK